MGLHHSPKIVTNGLVLALDAADRNSYPGSGTTWFDLAGSNNGTLTNGPTYNSANGGSIVLDGANDYVNFGNILNTGTGSFAIEYIAKASAMSSNYGKILSKGFYATAGFASFFGKLPDNSYVISFEWRQLDGSWSGIGNFSPSLDTWYYVVQTYNSSSGLMSQYINTTLQSSASASPNITSPSYNYVIGGSNSGGLENFKGNVAILRQYNRALSIDEIQQNFNALRGRFGI